MPIDIRAWLDQAQASLQAAFGPRLLFLGLQGSYGRGEAQEGSDIDLVVILDEAAPEDWRIYRGLAHWDRADLFQFVHDTTPILGDLNALVPPIGRADVERALRRTACDVYHITGHNLLHGRSVEVLSAQFKSAAFALRASHYLSAGIFLRSTEDLAAALTPCHRAILEGRAGLTAANLEGRSLLLLAWASSVLEELS